jgi:BlaI family transcriptional regulator, penicillinase repressor
MPVKGSLSRRERQIMYRVYARGRATAEEIREELPGNIGNSAVRTLLSILEEKGFLTHETEGKRFIYLPTRPKEEVGTEALKDVVSTFFANSASLAMAALIEDGSGKLSPEEQARLADLIASKEPEGN